MSEEMATLAQVKPNGQEEIIPEMKQRLRPKFAFKYPSQGRLGVALSLSVSQ